jgi:hypothetical protein
MGLSSVGPAVCTAILIIAVVLTVRQIRSERRRMPRRLTIQGARPYTRFLPTEPDPTWLADEDVRAFADHLSPAGFTPIGWLRTDDGRHAEWLWSDAARGVNAIVSVARDGARLDFASVGENGAVCVQFQDRGGHRPIPGLIVLDSDRTAAAGRADDLVARRPLGNWRAAGLDEYARLAERLYRDGASSRCWPTSAGWAAR